VTADVTRQLSAGVQFPLFPATDSVVLPLILKEDTWSVLSPFETVQDAAGGASALSAPASAPAVPAPRVFDRSRRLEDGGKSAASWHLEQLEWEHAYVTRMALAEYDPSLGCECAGEGRILQHAHSDRQRLTPYRCQVRATCPACGRSYGQGRGAELVSLLKTVLEPGRLVSRESYALAWHLVISCDQRISDYVNDLVVAGEVAEVRRVLVHLNEDVQSTLEGVYGDGVAAVVNWHWWHSSNPLAGKIHLHAHVTVPNVSVVDGKPFGALREQAKLSDDELFALRHGFAKEVSRHFWVKKLIRRTGGVVLSENVHVKFSTRMTGGRNSLSHRLRYDTRSSVVDVSSVTASDQLRQAKKALWGDGVVDDLEEQQLDELTQVQRLLDNPAGLEWWINAAHLWQGIQTTRYTGWLVNRMRAELGMVREKPDLDENPDWSSVGLYRLLTMDSGGVQVERWREGKRYLQHWHGDYVQLLPPPTKSARWCWDDVIRPERVSGPPVAWLCYLGLPPYI
jgi:hypothetical protein